MPIQLTSAFEPGDFDPGETYAQLAIEYFRFAKDEVRLSCHYGDTVSGNWVRGTASQEMVHTISNVDPTYEVNALIATGAALQTSGDPVPDELYQWLLDKGLYAGTIVT